MLTHEYLSVEEMADRIVKQYPEYENLNKRYLSGTVAAVLSHFEKQGYVERKKFGHGFQSEVTLSDEQRETVVSFVTLIDKFKNGDSETINEGRRFAQKVASDPILFSELMLKAKEASPFANRVEIEEMNYILLSIVQEHPNSTTNQIMQILEQYYGKRLTPSAVRRNLSPLVEEELIISEPTKAGNVYKVVEEESKTLSAQN